MRNDTVAQEELNPVDLSVTMGDMPEDYIELEDGSVEIPDLEPVGMDTSEFYTNLAESLPQDELNDISSDLIELIEKDKQARKKRDEQYEEGIRRTGLGDDAPGGAQFDGASRVVHPVMAEACVDFASSAIKELFPPSGPVKTDHIGIVTKEQVERGTRKKELMNWQLTKQMPEYFDELEQLLSQMPLGGAQYLKMRWDEALRRPVAEFVPIDEILLPYAATSFYTAQRLTHRQLITRHTYEERVDSGFYRETNAISEGETPEQTSSALANDKIEGNEDTAYNEDGLRAVLEVYTWLEVEDPLVKEGKAPYVLHIDEHSEEVLAIYRNWDDEDLSLEKLDWIVEFKFIPWRGAYGIGLPHLIGGLSAALTGSLRALLDSAHINNAPSMLKLKSARGVPGSNTTVNITEVTEIDAPPNVTDIRQLAMPMPFNPPSPVLFNLLGFLTEAAKGVVSTAEEKIANAGNQMPVGTAMALIEQGSKVFSAIHGRLHRSQAKVLEILCRINSKWLDEADQEQKLGKVLATKQDFIGSMDVVPASDPNIFSETQRYAQLQALLQMSQDQRVQWNVNKIYERLLNLMHVSQPEEMLPIQSDAVTADPVTENDTALRNKPIKAEDTQDHMTHIQAHLACVSTPWIVSNPMIPPNVIQGILAHINEHIVMYQQQVTVQTTNTLLQEAQSQGVFVTPEQLTPMAIQQASQVLGQQLQPIMQQLQAVQQQLQQRIPPQPLPPEVQASKEIAMADIQRKSQYDQATLESKRSEQQAKQQLDAAQFQADQAKQMFDQQMEQAQQRFEQFMETQAVMAKQREDELNRQVELLRNEQNNQQHQMTELLKNHEDNQTERFIEQMKLQLQPLQTQVDSMSSGVATAPDLAPQMQQMTMMLDQLGKQQTNDALGSVIEGLRATMETLNKPKMLIRDQQGKAVGVQ